MKRRIIAQTVGITDYTLIVSWLGKSGPEPLLCKSCSKTPGLSDTLAVATRVPEFGRRGAVAESEE
jgi:hypothetical protein